MRFESYAQEWEDVILYVALRGIQKGFYIDVGANDPEDLSVTNFFYQEGWSGINIEPLRSKCMLLQCKRERDINLCVGIGNRREKLPLVSSGMCSTFSDSVANMDHICSQNKFVKAMYTLSDIYRQYCSPHQPIHFCKIDVEGFEKQVLEGIEDWDVFRPWIYVIESTLPGTDIPCYDKWEHILTENGYMHAYGTTINRYYVDERREYLLDGFKEIGEFVRCNEIVKMRVEAADKILLEKFLMAGGQGIGHSQRDCTGI